MIIYRDIRVCILVPKGLELSDDICPAFQMVSDNFSALTSDNVFELDKFYVVRGNKFVLYCRYVVFVVASALLYMNLTTR